jgi:hypothetical protein
VGAFGQALAEPLDFAGMRFSLIGGAAMTNMAVFAVGPG